MQISRDVIAEIGRPQVWIDWGERALRVFIILALAWVFNSIARRLLRQLRNYAIHVIDRRHEGSTFEMEKRATTLISVLSKMASLVVWTVALVMALTETGFNIQPLLAGIGAAGLALGLGAQTLIRDWLGGLLMLLEDQLRIGDSVIINGIAGSVEEINLRTTLLRGENGAVHVITNGSITTLSNLTREYSYYVFETTLARGSDVDRALSIVEAEGAQLAGEEPYRNMIISPIEVMGVERLAERGVIIKARVKTLPAKSAIVGRELNRRVRARLIAEKIAFP